MTLVDVVSGDIAYDRLVLRRNSALGRTLRDKAMIFQLCWLEKRSDAHQLS